MVSIRWEHVRGRRLRRQLLVEPAPDALAAASRIGGIHSQVASGARLIAGVRTAGPGAPDLDDALWNRRSLVKTWGMRGTLHLFPSAELPMWVAAFRQRQWPRFTPSWEKYHGVTGDELRAITDAVGTVLPGRTMTRDELAEAVAAELGAAHLAERIRSGWGQMLKPAAAGGLLCFGPDRGRNVTFASPREWIGTWDEPDHDAAMREVVVRFLDAYGPATHEDFGRWWGTDAASARRVFKAHADAMVEVDLDGQAVWTTPEAADQLARDEPPARGIWLLPGFDPYVIAPLSHRAHTIPDGFVDRVSRTAGWISPVLVVDGMVRGVWAPERSGETVAIEVKPFVPVDASTRAGAEEHGRRYAELLSAQVELSWS